VTDRSFGQHSQQLPAQRRRAASKQVGQLRQAIAVAHRNHGVSDFSVGKPDVNKETTQLLLNVCRWFVARVAAADPVGVHYLGFEYRRYRPFQHRYVWLKR